MGVLQTLIDTRKMKRMASLLQQNDSDRAASQLEDILKEALAVQMSGNIRAQTNAIQEIKSLRDAMIAGSINAGKSTSKMIGAFTLASEEMERETQKLMNKLADETKIDVGFLADRLPSMDALTSALITANPFMGYGVKIVRDIGKELKNRKMQRQVEQRQRLELVQQQQQRFAEMLQDSQNEETSESKKSPDTTESNDKSQLLGVDLESPWVKFFEPYSTGSLDLLEDIEYNTFRLAKIWDDSHDRIVRINREQEREDKRLKKEADDERKRIEDQERLQRERDIETPNLPQIINPPDIQSEDEEQGGFAAILGGLLGGLTGGGVIAAISAIEALFASITSIGAVAMGILKKGTPLAAIMAVYDFLDGFFSAKDILGKSNVTIRERIETGLSNVLAGFISIADTVLEFFGVDVIKKNKKELAKTMSLSLHETVDKFVDLAKSLWDGIVEFFISVKDEIMAFFDDPIEYMKEFTQDFIDNSYLGQAGSRFIQMPDYENNPGKREQDQIEAAQRLHKQMMSGGVVGESKTSYSVVKMTADSVNATKQSEQKSSAPVVVSAPTTNVNNTSTVSGNSSPRNTDPAFRSLLNRNY